MDSTKQARFESALPVGGYDGLIDLVLQLKAEGLTQIEIYDLFTQSMLWLRESGRQDDEDKVTDVMDFIVGWCSSHMKLFPDNLTNEEIDNYRKGQQRCD
jgi:hypothetical protein